MLFWLTLRKTPRPFWTVIVSRLLFLFVYALFAPEGASLFGRTLDALPLALWAYFTQHMISLLLFARPDVTGAFPRAINPARSALVCLAPVILLLSEAQLQFIFILGNAALLFIYLLFFFDGSDDIEKTPLGRWFAGEDAITVGWVRLFGWTLFLLGSILLYRQGDAIFWVTWHSFGYLVWKFIIDWVITLLIYAGDVSPKN